MNEAAFDELAEQLENLRGRHDTPYPILALVEAVRCAGASAVLSESGVRKVVAAASASRWRLWGMVTVLLQESEGLVAPEHSENYVRAVLNVAGGELRLYLFENSTTFVESLVWRLFEVGGGGEASLSNCDKFFRPSWTAEFHAQIAAGVLPRDRVLRSCLEALARGFGAYVSGWYSRLYAELQPTVVELAADEKPLRNLLRSPISASASLAVKQLDRLAESDQLDGDAYLVALPALGPITFASAKTALDRAIALTVETPALVASAKPVVLSALEHRDSRIQLSAVRWLHSQGFSAAVEDAAASLAPSVATAAKVARPTAAALVTPMPEARTWAPVAAVPQEGLAEHFAALLEDCRDPIAVEVGLQALAASNDRSSLGSLHKRARSVSERRVAWDFVSFEQLVARLVLAALGEATAPSGNTSSVPPFVLARLEELRLFLLAGGGSYALLATPDDAAGRIRPATLAARIAHALDTGSPVWHFDAVAALLRLDTRDPGAFVSRRAELWQAFEFALGGPIGDLRTPAWWIAAARARDPLAECDQLVVRGYTLDGQGGELDSEIATESRTYSSGTFEHVFLTSSTVRSAPFPERSWVADQPTVLPRRELNAWGTEGGLDNATARFAGIVWPASTEFASAVGVSQASMSSRYQGSTPTGLTGALLALQESPAELGSLGRSTLAFGLSASDSLHRATASEIVAESIGTRTTPAELAQSMAEVARAVKLSRWASALADAASISLPASHGVIDLLTRLLPKLDRGKTGMSSLIDLLHEGLVARGVGSTDAELLDWLSGFSGSSKAAKAAKSIIRLAS